MIYSRNLVTNLLAIIVLLCGAATLCADQWEFDLYIKAVKEGKYKDDMKAVAAIVGISEQELFDKYVAKNFKIEVVLRASLFAKELNQELPTVLKNVSYYAEGNSKRWKKYYKDENIPADVVDRVTKKYDELAKDALKNWAEKNAADNAARTAAKAEEERLAKLPPDPRMAVLVYRVAQHTRITVGGTRNIVDGMIKSGYSFDEAADAAVFAAVTGHFEQKFRIEATPERKGKLLESLCVAFPPTPEQKEEILLVSTLIKSELKDSSIIVQNPKEILKETQLMRDIAAVISEKTKVPSTKIIVLYRQVTSDEEVVRACVIASRTGKAVDDIMRARREGGMYEGWLNLYATHNLIEQVDQITDQVNDILVAVAKVTKPKVD